MTLTFLFKSLKHLGCRWKINFCFVKFLFNFFLRTCCGVSFCSVECRDKALNSYHRLDQRSKHLFHLNLQHHHSILTAYIFSLKQFSAFFVINHSPLNPTTSSVDQKQIFAALSNFRDIQNERTLSMTSHEAWFIFWTDIFIHLCKLWISLFSRYECGLLGILVASGLNVYPFLAIRLLSR